MQTETHHLTSLLCLRPSGEDVGKKVAIKDTGGAVRCAVSGVRANLRPAIAKPRRTDTESGQIVGPDPGSTWFVFSSILIGLSTMIQGLGKDRGLIANA